MRDYTTNHFCDYLWIGDLLELKQNDKREFCLEVNNNNRKPIKIKIVNVIIFGTIVEVKQVACSGYLYHVDDGTGVIPCKRSEDNFQEVIRSIEDEQIDVSNQTFECSVTDISTNDTIFNDQSIQLEEINFNKKSRLLGLQSMWNDIYDSFHSLIEPYTVGDSVIVQGKLYSYINMNQIYVNNIRPMGIAEEIIQISIKLEDGLDKSNKKEISKKQTNPVSRMSGLMTFDNIPHLDPKITNPRTIKPTELKMEVLNDIPDVVTPNLETALTFDTFTTQGQNQKLGSFILWHFCAEFLEKYSGGPSSKVSGYPWTVSISCLLSVCSSTRNKLQIIKPKPPRLKRIIQRKVYGIFQRKDHILEE